MKAVSLFAILLLSLSSIGVLAQSSDSSSTPILEELPNPSVLPGDTLYGLKTAWENVRFTLKFSDKSKAEYALKLAMTRVAEAQKLREKGDSDGAEKAETRGQNLLETARKHAEKVEDVEVAAELETRARNNVATIQSLIAKRTLANETNGLKGLQTALEQFQKQAEMSKNASAIRESAAENKARSAR